MGGRSRWAANDPQPIDSTEAGAFEDHSGTIDDADTSQLVMTIPAGCDYWVVQNVSDTDMWLNVGVDASAGAGSFFLPALGGSFETSNFVPTGAINILCASADKAFTAKLGTAA